MDLWTLCYFTRGRGFLELRKIQSVYLHKVVQDAGLFPKGNSEVIFMKIISQKVSLSNGDIEKVFVSSNKVPNGE